MNARSKFSLKSWKNAVNCQGARLIVKVHTRFPLAGKQLKELLSHLFPHSEPVFSGLFQNFFNFFFAAEIDLTTEEIDVRSISAIFL